jgi:hypothetical protein
MVPSLKMPTKLLKSISHQTEGLRELDCYLPPSNVTASIESPKSLLVGFLQEILLQFWWEVKRLLANIEGVEQLAVSL